MMSGDEPLRTDARLASLAQLQAFVAAAETRSFTKAAAALGISQPAISQLVCRMELDLETSLINRRGRTLELTAPGLRMLPYAAEAVLAARKAVQAVRDASHA